MARGSIAKEMITNKIIDCFGSDFVGVFDKKIYLWSEENGEKLQVCLTLTCPKTLVGQDNATSDVGVVNSVTNSVEISDQERKTVEDLMNKLGL